MFASSLGNQIYKRIERARAVRQDGPDTQVLAGLGEAANDDRRESVHVDVAATQHWDDYLVVVVREPAFEQRRKRHRAGPLDEGLAPLQQSHDCGGSLGIGDGHHLVDPLADDLKGLLAERAGSDTVGDGVDAVEFDPFAPLQRGPGARCPLCLDTDDPDIRVVPLECGGNPRDEAAAADWNDHGVDLGQVLDYLQPDCSLAGHHRPVLERRQVVPPFLALYLVGAFGGRVVIDPVEYYLAAVGAGRLDLPNRRALRHDNRGVDTHSRGRERDTLCVIARTRGDDTVCECLRVQGGDAVCRPAYLERTGPLEHLAFEVDLCACHRGEGVRVRQRCVSCRLGNPLSGRLDVVEFEHTGDSHSRGLGVWHLSQVRPRAVAGVAASGRRGRGASAGQTRAR